MLYSLHDVSSLDCVSFDGSFRAAAVYFFVPAHKQTLAAPSAYRFIHPGCMTPTHYVLNIQAQDQTVQVFRQMRIHHRVIRHRGLGYAKPPSSNQRWPMHNLTTAIRPWYITSVFSSLFNPAHHHTPASYSVSSFQNPTRVSSHLFHELTTFVRSSSTNQQTCRHSKSLPPSCSSPLLPSQQLPPQQCPSPLALPLIITTITIFPQAPRLLVSLQASHTTAIIRPALQELAPQAPVERAIGITTMAHIIIPLEQVLMVRSCRQR